MQLSFGAYRLRRQERLVIGPDGPVDLSARAFDLLCLLIDRSSDVVSKDDIFAAVWPGVVVEENTLHVHVSALRKVLPPDMIVMVHGRGYKFAGPVPGAANARSSTTGALPASKPVIAVLPFENLGGDPEQQYFSDGITQDIIDRLTRFRMLSVIGQDSTSEATEDGTFPSHKQKSGAAQRRCKRLLANEQQRPSLVSRELMH